MWFRSNKPLDCTRLKGRMRDICEGKSGLPPAMEAAYRERWARGRPIGLGDIVEKLIRTVTFGRLRPKAWCGCAKRKAKLNRWVLWYYQPHSRLG